MAFDPYLLYIICGNQPGLNSLGQLPVMDTRFPLFLELLGKQLLSHQQLISLMTENHAGFGLVSIHLLTFRHIVSSSRCSELHSRMLEVSVLLAQSIYRGRQARIECRKKIFGLSRRCNLSPFTKSFTASNFCGWFTEKGGVERRCIPCYDLHLRIPLPS